jgi:hypothetical protein
MCLLFMADTIALPEAPPQSLRGPRSTTPGIRPARSVSVDPGPHEARRITRSSFLNALPRPAFPVRHKRVPSSPLAPTCPRWTCCLCLAHVCVCTIEQSKICATSVPRLESRGSTHRVSCSKRSTDGTSDPVRARKRRSEETRTRGLDSPSDCCCYDIILMGRVPRRSRGSSARSPGKERQARGALADKPFSMLLAYQKSR